MKVSRADQVLEDWDMVSREARPPTLARRATISSLAVTGSMVPGAAAVLIVLLAVGVWYGSLQGHGVGGMSPSASSIEAWGPLAVARAIGGDDALTAGRIRITDDCVFLEGPGKERSLLVWPADRSAWTANSRTITFRNPDGSTVPLRDGDQVTIGGGGDSDVESSISGDEWVRRTEWVAAPAPSCPIRVRWSVTEVTGSE